MTITIRRILVASAITVASAGVTASILSALFATAPTATATTAQHEATSTETRPSQAEAEPVEENTPTEAQPAPEQSAPTTSSAPRQEQQATPAAQPQPVPQENRLIIPSIGVNSVITSVGLTADGAVDVPATNVGMWAGSPAPGAHGATFLDGHSPGILSALNQVGVGQTFQVIYGGQTYTYRVAHTETIPLDSVNMRRALAVYGNGDGLNIMTCAGQFAPSRNTYDHRLIVYAVAV